MSRTATATWAEARFWGRSLTRLLTGHPGPVAVALAVAWLVGPRSLWVLAPAVLVAIGLRVWARTGPVFFARRVAGPMRARLARRRIRRLWPEVCAACDLGYDEQAPRPRMWASWPRVELCTRPVMGQTVEDFQVAAEAVRTAIGASQIRVEPTGAVSVSVLFTFGDELAVPFDAQVPAVVDPALRLVSMGRRSDGHPWSLPLGPHTLVAGSSGSGKGSLFWSFAFGLAPAVREGRVQLHGVDLKGGMEILMGEELFTTRATSAAEAVALLELLVGWMRQRTALYAGRLRSHTATVEEPMHVVMVDELAALTAYSTDRELQRRAEASLNLLCSQGRAPGFMVFACLQDPRKEVIPSRGLFTQMVGLRLKDLSETTMVLGEQAVQTGAHCHRITRDVPGTGYVIPEEGGQPIRVRAGFASDEVIRAVSERYATPTRLSLLVPAADGALEGGSRRGRSRGGSS